MLLSFLRFLQFSVGFGNNWISLTSLDHFTQTSHNFTQLHIALFKISNSIKDQTSFVQSELSKHGLYFL